jgi:aminopeptidase YwaD
MRAAKFLFLILFALSAHTHAQDMTRVRQTLDTLSAPGMHGRGYVNNGEQIAAQYIKQRFEEIGLRAIKGNYFQKFTLDINTFPGQLDFQTNKNKLTPGTDYILKPISGSGKGRGKVLWLDSLIFVNEDARKNFLEKSIKKRIFVYHARQYAQIVDLPVDYIKKIHEAKAIVELDDRKLTMGLSSQQHTNPFFHISDKAIDRDVKRAKFRLDAELKKNYETQNVIGFIPGSTKPDSFLVISAHYDHLGRLGKDTYFPGANDNASGVSMMLELAHFYAQPENKPEYTMVFIAFGAEEAGLLGSKYFVDHPLIPLKKIRFLVNLDMLGTGDDGMMVVNGKVFSEEFQLLENINQEHGYLPAIKSRGEAANSDHYYFYLKGVPCFFFYTLGGIAAYHDVMDRPETLPLTKFPQVFDLIKSFFLELEPSSN